MVGTDSFLFAELLVLGLLYFILAYFEYKTVDLANFKPFFRGKVISIFIFVIGVLIHTLGGVVGYELELQTLGHVLMMIGAIVLIKQALNLFKLAEEYGYG